MQKSTLPPSKNINETQTRNLNLKYVIVTTRSILSSSQLLSYGGKTFFFFFVESETTLISSHKLFLIESFIYSLK